jgi:hypothetical protein
VRGAVAWNRKPAFRLFFRMAATQPRPVDGRPLEEEAMRSPIRAAGAALILSALILPSLALAQAPATPPPPAQQEAGQKDKLPVIKPPAQIDPGMVKPAPDAGPNSTPVVKPPPGNGDPVVPK